MYDVCMQKIRGKKFYPRAESLIPKADLFFIKYFFKDTVLMGRAGKVLRLVRVMRILRVFKVIFWIQKNPFILILDTTSAGETLHRAPEFALHTPASLSGTWTLDAPSNGYCYNYLKVNKTFYLSYFERKIYLEDVFKVCFFIIT